MSLDWTAGFAGRARAIKPSAIRAVSRYAGEPGVISFASGSPNPALFPHEAVSDALRHLAEDQALRNQALQYGASEGFLPLRQLIAERLAGAGAACGPENILVTNGSQQALEFLGTLFIDPGDTVIVTEPTYLGALQAFGLSQPRYVGVPVDEGGLDLPALERAFAAGAKFLYLMPDFGNPSGLTLPLSHRRRVLELARRHGVPVIEDQAYDQLRLSGEALPSLLALDGQEHGQEQGQGGCVIHAGTFSKSLAPGLRVGWLVAPEPVIAKLVSIKQASDLHVGVLNQTIVHQVMRNLPPGHGDALRAAYRGQRDAMLDSLVRHMPPGTSWSRPDGGMFVWLTLPGGLDAQDVLRAAMEGEKVLFVPGAPFFTDGSGASTLRLSFSLVTPALIEEGIARLGRVVARCLNQANKTEEVQR